jgi:predicted polyphosphate/ATP-dependent NAD kinase
MISENLRRTIGLIVNPIAGMGGSVGLKGTDGAMHRKALELGARAIAPGRTRELLSRIKRSASIHILAAPGIMGERYLAETDLQFSPIGVLGAETSSEDTRRLACAMRESKVDLLVFVGGDGTARDIYDAVGLSVPVVAVPCGVKVYSAVFAVNARAAAEMLNAFVDGVDVCDEEVLDIDEVVFRQGRLEARLYGYLSVPNVRAYIQGGKESSSLGEASAEAKQELANSVIGDMDRGTLYLLGPGTTVKAISDRLGLAKTLLGVDAVRDHGLLASDLNEQKILQLLDAYEQAKIIVTPLGGNGFIFGRGNKQFTPRVIKRVGKANIVVIATREKMRTLKVLRIDTGDYQLDESLAGYIEVTVGFHHTKMTRVSC